MMNDYARFKSFADGVVARLPESQRGAATQAISGVFAGAILGKMQEMSQVGESGRDAPGQVVGMLASRFVKGWPAMLYYGEHIGDYPGLTPQKVVEKVLDGAMPDLGAQYRDHLRSTDPTGFRDYLGDQHADRMREATALQATAPVIREPSGTTDPGLLGALIADRLRTMREIAHENPVGFDR